MFMLGSSVVRMGSLWQQTGQYDDAPGTANLGFPRTAPCRAFTWDTGRGFLEVCPAPRLPASCMFKGKPGFLGSLKKNHTHKTSLHLVLILWGNIAVKKSWLCLILIYLFSVLSSFDASGL